MSPRTRSFQTTYTLLLTDSARSRPPGVTQTSDQPTSSLSTAQSASTPGVADSSTVSADSTNTPPLSEHERLVAAVMAINPAQSIEIVELIEGVSRSPLFLAYLLPSSPWNCPRLVGIDYKSRNSTGSQLPKKERVMCLFNPEVLRQKVQDALLVLEAAQEEEAHGLESAPDEQNGKSSAVSSQDIRK